MFRCANLKEVILDGPDLIREAFYRGLRFLSKLSKTLLLVQTQAAVIFTAKKKHWILPITMRVWTQIQASRGLLPWPSLVRP